MTVRISAEASAQIANHDISMFTQGKLYDSDDNYLTDLDLINASWNQSKDFGVSVMNVVINNSGGKHDKGAPFEILSDYIIVLIEGYDTSFDTDKFPKFKGYVKEINNTITQGVSQINVTIYDQMVITQRSDLDKVFVADTTQISGQTFSPVIEGELGRIDGDPSGESVRITYTQNNYGLSGLMSAEYFFADTKMLKNNLISIVPDGSKLGMIFYSGSITGTLSANDVLVNADGSYRAVINSGVNSTYSLTGEPTILIKVSDLDGPLGNFGNGDTLYVQSDPSNYFTAKAFFQVNAVSFDNITINASGVGVSNGDIVHNGLINSYRSPNPNWATYKPHSIKVTETGIITQDDIYDGYETNHSAGLIRLNQSVRIDKYTVNGSYEYIPVGLYIEDVLRDLLIEEDGLCVNQVVNGGFTQGTSSWSKDYGNGATANDFTIGVEEGLKIASTTTLLANEYIGISQSSINVLSGYTYTVTARIIQLNGTSGNVTVSFGGDSFTSGASYFTDVQTIQFTTTPTASASTSISIQLSGCSLNDVWRINDVSVTYNPAKTNALSLDNLYCLTSIEDGATDDYVMTTNSTYQATPRFTTITSRVTDITDTINVVDTAGYDNSGIIQLGSEYITYTSKTSETFSGITRASFGTTQSNHEIGTRTWQVLSGSKLWYTKYSNIIPSTENSTASDYDAVNGVNIGSAGSFTITGGTFKEFWYRQGIVIVSGTVTDVTHTLNKDYLFNQLQSTGVETPYVLIDYRALNTRFDAIQEIRSMLAPNYIISTVVRTSGSGYSTYIKGRYLAQKSTQDYDLDFITSISYNNNIRDYNRVKMFGKLANPTNLMYDPSTAIIPVTDLDTEYLKGVQYRYVDTNGPYYIFSPTVEKRFGNVSDSLSTKIDFNYNKVLTTGNKHITWRVVDSSSGEDYYLIRLNNHYVVNVGTVTNYVAGIRAYASYENPSRYIKYSELPPRWTYVIEVLNPYFVTYTTSGTFSTGDTICGSGVINKVIALDPVAPYDALIYVKHSVDATIFSNGLGVNNGSGVSGTIVYPIVEGAINQRNYNVSTVSRINIAGAYKPTYTSFDDTISITPQNIMNNVNGYKLYLDGFENTQVNSSYEQVLVPLGSNENYDSYGYREGGIGVVFGIVFLGKWVEYSLYRRPFGGLGVYLNEDYNEYQTHPHNPPGLDLPYGTVRFEQHLGEARNNLLTINYYNQPGYWFDPERGHGTVTEQLRAGGYLYFKNPKGADLNSMDIVRNAIYKATHVRYYKRFKTGVEFNLTGDFLYINKADMDASNYVPTEVDVKIDGEYVTSLPNEYINTPNKSLIERVRDFSRKGREEQIGISSRFQVNEIPLCVIDLGSIKSIRYIDIQGGYLYKPSDTGDNAPYPCNFKVSVRYSDQDVPFDDLLDSDFNVISNDTEGISMSEGDVQSLDESQLGERFKTRYLKFFVDTGDNPDIEEGTESDLRQWYGAALAGIAIYESDLIVSEQYVDADVINMYKDTTVYEQLSTQELVDTYASARLTEFQKGITETTVQIPYSPHYEIGLTVRLNDTENSVDQNYFIEEIASSNGAITATLAYYP
jgi:hypothetical protein